MRRRRGDDYELYYERASLPMWPGPGAGWVKPGPENRTQVDAPYAYSEFFVFRDGKVRPGGQYHAVCDEGVEGVYSDRLAEWDRDAFKRGIEACGTKNRMTHWSKANASKFLTAYYGKPTTAHAMAEGCNVSNGYPYWIFWFSHPEPKAAKK